MRGPEVVLHRALDRLHEDRVVDPARIDQPQQRRHQLLVLKHEPVLVALGRELQRRAQSEQGVARSRDHVADGPRDRAAVDERGDVPLTERRLEVPLQAGQIAQSPGAVLEVGLDEVHRAAVLVVALFDLGVEALEQGAALLAAEPALGLGAQLGHDPRVPGEGPHVEQRGRSGQILGGLGEPGVGVVDHEVGAQAHVPHRMDDRGDEVVERLRPRRLGRRPGEQHEVDVAVRAQLAPGERADRGQRHRPELRHALLEDRGGVIADPRAYGIRPAPEHHTSRLAAVEIRRQRLAGVL